MGVRRIKTASEAIDTLGGTGAVAALFAVPLGVVSAWRKRGLPAKTYCALAPLLVSRRLSFDPSLFGMLRPSR